MTTLATMKSRIADELGDRTDIDSQIANAISDAIAAYQDERWWFNETRALTFTTTAEQEFYGADDAADIGNIQKIDYVMLYVGSVTYRLEYKPPFEVEALSLNGVYVGVPWAYTWYGAQMRLYPSPVDAYTVRVGCSVIIAAPASDTETGNHWMTSAERLIRSRAKLELALHVLKDTALAQTMEAAVSEAWKQLKSRTNQLTQPEGGRVRAMQF